MTNDSVITISIFVTRLPFVSAPAPHLAGVALLRVAYLAPSGVVCEATEMRSQWYRAAFGIVRPFAGLSLAAFNNHPKITTAMAIVARTAPDTQSRAQA